METLLQSCIVLAVGIIIFSALSHDTPTHKRESAISPPPPPVQSYHIKQGPAVTRASPWTNRTTSVVRLKPILQRLLKKHAQYRVLCMHHVEEMDHPYRACMVANGQQFYLLLNPEMRGNSVESHLLHQTSISCDKPYQSHRYEVVFIEWDDFTTSSRLYARFDGPTAIELQIAMDEFRGDAHCSIPKKLQANTAIESSGTQR